MEVKENAIIELKMEIPKIHFSAMVDERAFHLYYMAALKGDCLD